MPRLVTKFKYMKPGSGGKSVGGYARYIATREGVEKIDSKSARLKSSQRTHFIDSENSLRRKNAERYAPLGYAVLSWTSGGWMFTKATRTIWQIRR